MIVGCETEYLRREGGSGIACLGSTIGAVDFIRNRVQLTSAADLCALAVCLLRGWDDDRANVFVVVEPSPADRGGDYGLARGGEFHTATVVNSFEGQAIACHVGVILNPG